MYNYRSLNAPWYDSRDSIDWVIIEKGVTSVGDYAFYNCRNVISIEIPEGVTYIGWSAFSKCSSLTKMEIPYGVTYLGLSAFDYDTSLTEVWLSEGITSIETSTFSGCTKLANIKIPHTVTSIGRDAFYGCWRMEMIEIPHSVTEIGDIAFLNCSALKRVYYTGTEEEWNSINIGADNECLTYAYIYYESTLPSPTPQASPSPSPTATPSPSPTLDASPTPVPTSGVCGDNLTWELREDGTLTISGTGDMYDYSGNYQIPWYVSRSDVKRAIIGDGVTNICNYAFFDCSNLVDIELPEGITSIGVYAFDWCVNLEKILLPESVKVIEWSAFDNCPGLTGINISGSMKEIKKGAFRHCCALKTVCYPGTEEEWNSITIMGDNECLTLAYIQGINPPDPTPDPTPHPGPTEKPTEAPILTSGTYGDNLTWEFAEDGTLIISGTGKMYNYNLFQPWDSVAKLIKRVVIDERVTSVSEHAFYNCINLTDVVIPEGITSIGTSAFRNCKSLTDIAIPQSVTSIGESAFDNCTSLENVELSERIVYMGKFAFYKCESLKKILLPENLKEIDWYTFGECSSLTSVKIPGVMQKIRENAFLNCSALEKAYYAGTEEEWNSIKIEEGNECLTLAYTQEPKDWVEFTRIKDDLVLAELKFEKTQPPEQEEICVYVAFRKNGRLEGVQMPKVTGMTVLFDIPDKFEDCDVELYVWDKNMKPLMDMQQI